MTRSLSQLSTRSRTNSAKEVRAMTPRRTVAVSAAMALALVLVWMSASPEAQGRGQQGGLPALAARVQALEQAVNQLQADLAAESADRMGADTALQNNLDAEAAARAAADTALQAQIATLSGEVAGLQQLFANLNTAVNTASGDILSLMDRVAALEDALAGLGGGPTSYDGLAGTPCTTAGGTAGTVHLVGLQRSPICANLSANARFIDYGLVVLDTQTNLMWEKKDQSGGLHDVGNTYHWCTATGNTTGPCFGNVSSWIGQVNAERFAGFSDWRVPTLDELLTIVETNVPGCGVGTPCIDPIFGPTQRTRYYLSATEASLGNAWGVHFFNGSSSQVGKTFGQFPVRAVRAGS